MLDKTTQGQPRLGPLPGRVHSDQVDKDISAWAVDNTHHSTCMTDTIAIPTKRPGWHKCTPRHLDHPREKKRDARESKLSTGTERTWKDDLFT